MPSTLPALPLRLAAEPCARSVFPSSVALGVHLNPTHAHGGHLELAAIVDDDGIRAFATSAPISRRVLLELLEYPPEQKDALYSSSSSVAAESAAASTLASSSSNWGEGPILCLVRTSASSNAMEWHMYNAGDEFPTKVVAGDASTVRSMLATVPKCHDAFVARLLTESIRIYYAQQVLEPSVRGFLTVLEKQFARSDLYLFELLQNAVDDGASDIQMMVVRGKNTGINGNSGNSSSDGGGGLSFSHNGRNFTPLDVLGLSSVGLSTKSREGKRTIGFMGVGFKACYKRYNRVVINDGRYNFAYERKQGDTGYGWVMQPTWVESNTRTKDGDNGWCRFSLELPVGGVASVEKDLSVLPPTAPPLLGRAALEKRWEGDQQNNDGNTWTLNWNGKNHRIKRTSLNALTGSSRSKDSFHTAADRSEIVNVEISDQSGHTTTTRWLFVSHKYTPSSQAAKSYLNHTKRSHSGQEEVSGFIKLGGEGGFTPIYRVSAKSGAHLGGIVHSVLPTKLRMPVPMNIQGPWLLSVDRQDVQDLGDNLWNKDLVQRLPMLVVNSFRWAASEHLSSAPQYRALGKLLPVLSLESPSAGSSAWAISTELLGQTVSLDVLARAFFSERILPVAIPAEDGGEDTTTEKSHVKPILNMATDYYEGRNTIWIPPSFLSNLSPSFLRGWLGKRPLRSDIFGEIAFHSIFASDRVIGQLDAVTIRSRRDQLAREVGSGPGKQVSDEVIKNILSLMVAIGAAYDEHPSQAETSFAGGKANKKQKVDNRKGKTKDSSAIEAPPVAPQAPPPVLPDISCWPVFLTSDGQLSTLDQIVLPSEDFADIPEQLRAKLRSHYITRAADASAIGSGRDFQRGSKRDFRGRGKQNKRSGSRSPPPPQKKVLHPLLEDSLLRIPSPANSDTSKDAAMIQSFLDRVRSSANSSNVVSVASAATNLMSSHALASSALSEDQIAIVLEITAFAYQSSNSALLSHVMVDCLGEKTRLVNAQEAYIGKALEEGGRGEDLETFAGANSLRFLSSNYTAIEGDRRKLLALFEGAGVQSGLSAEVTAIIDIEKSDKSLLQREILPKMPGQKLPLTRKSTVKSTIYLPYDLDIVVDKRKFYVLDSQFSSEWERIVRSMTASCSVGFISLLLGMKFDAASMEINAKSNHALSSFISGQGGNDNDAGAVDDAMKEGARHGRKSVRISKNSSVPLRKRLAYLPPGQPGGKLLDLSESELVKQLSRWKWLPCAMPSARTEGSTPTVTLLKPEECLLSPDPNRPEMPLVTLPRLMLKRLEASEIAKTLIWGTRAPAPPVERLEELAREAVSLSKDDSNTSACSIVASELVSTWTSIARAHLRGDGLAHREKEKIRLICSRDGSSCIPVKISSSSTETSSGAIGIVPVNRCVLLGGDSESSSSDEILSLTVASFVASGFMYDMHSATCNPFFSTPEVSRAVIELAGIPTTAKLPLIGIRKASGAFIHHLSNTEPMIHRSSPLRAAFSFAMKHVMDMPSVLDKERLKLFAKRGPGSGSKSLPARWLPLTGGPSLPVLDDDKSRARSSLLSPEMGIQLLGVLNHTEKEDHPHARVLASIDRGGIAFLKVLRLSDKRFVVKTRASGSPNLVDGASIKIRLIMALLSAMNNDRQEVSQQFNATAGRDFLDPTVDSDVPELIKYEGISRQFQAPGMDSAISTKLYAVWGRAPKHLSTKRCILASGDADDYAIELEQLILNHAGVRLSPSLASSRECRAAFRLLSHLENNVSFNKFIARDFADSEVVERWRKLIGREKAIEVLRRAEKKRDAEALRNALMEAEEACDYDPDGGDAILQSARELLPQLEDEVRRRKEAEEKQKAAEEEEEAARLAAVKEEKEAFERWKEEEKQKALARIAGDGNDTVEKNPSANAPPVAGSGRGRGLTLPSWMTSADSLERSTEANGEGIDTATAGEAPAESQAIEEAKSLVSSIMNEAVTEPPPTPPAVNIGAVGRGRGVSNTPAWMTQQGADIAPASGAPPESTESSANSQVKESASATAAGRGRGNVSNLPAWMTNSASAGPESQFLASESSNDRFADANEIAAKRTPEVSADNEALQPNKKAKIEVEQPKNFNFALSISIQPSKLPEFVASVRPRIEEDAKKQFGSAKLERVDD